MSAYSLLGRNWLHYQADGAAGNCFAVNRDDDVLKVVVLPWVPEQILTIAVSYWLKHAFRFWTVINARRKNMSLLGRGRAKQQLTQQGRHSVH